MIVSRSPWLRPTAETAVHGRGRECGTGRWLRWLRLNTMNEWAQSERTLLVGLILMASAVSAAIGYILTQYFSVDVLSSLICPPDDCYGIWHGQRHCFSDYATPVTVGARPNPWNPPILPNPYPAAAMVPYLIFAGPAAAAGVPRLGLVAYLIVLTTAVFTPAMWAARGARGLERLVVFAACGVAAVPAWLVVDRGNAAGFLAPIGLVFLIALRRQRWELVAFMAILATLVKPQFVVLVVALFAARRWRAGATAVAGILVTSLAAYLLWPRDFPDTIGQSIQRMLEHGVFDARVGEDNVSFGKGVFTIPDVIKAHETGGKIPDGFLVAPRGLIGYAILIVFVVSLLVLGRRVQPVMVGVALLATAALFPPLSVRYYLVFAVPVAAIVARDPGSRAGLGIFEGLRGGGDHRRVAVGVCVSVATALTLAQVVLPIPRTQVPWGANVDDSTRVIAPILWLVVCVVIIASYSRRNDTLSRPPSGRPRSDFLDTARNASPGC